MYLFLWRSRGRASLFAIHPVDRRTRTEPRASLPPILRQ